MSPPRRGAPPLLGLAILLSVLFLTGALAQQRVQQAVPPVSFFLPDIDVTSTTPLPRVPPSPYAADPALLGLPICPAADGTPYAVLGFPGTPYVQRPFSNFYRAPPRAHHTTEACRQPIPGDPNPPHCMRAYDITIRAVQMRPFDTTIPACTAHPPTNLLSYNGSIPGPTIYAPVGHEVMVRFTNKITDPYFNIVEPLCTGTRSGRPTAVHLHGSASLAPYDGWAEDEICGGESKEYIYPNQRPTTGWYHDHALHITLDNAYHGLAGFYLMTEKVKLGGCGEPYNLEDIEELPMMLRDAVLTPTCQLYYDFLGPHIKNVYGDINTINGVPFPEMPLEPKWYRFRFLNAAVSRPFMVKIKDDFGRDIAQDICRIIGSDGGYRADPIPFPIEGLQMGVAERYDVVCNFAPYAGKHLYLWNGRNEAMMTEVPYFCNSHLLALISVSHFTSIPDPPVFNPALVPPSPLDIDKVLSAADIAQARTLIAARTPHRTFALERRRGQWVINGETWDTAKIAAADVGQNTWELWRIVTGGSWFHPLHVHLVDFFILQRGPANAAATDDLFSFERNSPKDMLFVGPDQELWVLVRFGAHRGDYMFHCHNLDHEDHDMMRAYSVVSGGLNAPSSLEPITTVAGVIYNNWGFNDPRLASASARPTNTWPTVTPNYLASLLDMNVYRIFYANITDIPGLLPPNNPWWSETCNPLPPLP